MMSLRSEPTRRSTRMRTLTTPAQEDYEARVDTFQQKLNSIKSEWRECFKEIERWSSDIKTLKSIDDLLVKGFEAYQKTSNEFCDFLRTVRTEQSANELAPHLLIKETLFGKINVGRSKIEYLISEGSFKSLTQRSLSSGYNQSSSRLIGYILLRKEAKLEAQRTMLKHLDEELVLEAQLKRLKAQREMKMVESELSVLKEDPRLQELAPSLSNESKTEEYLKLLLRYEQDRKQHEKIIETFQSNSFSDCRQKEDTVVSTPKQSSTSPPIATANVQEEIPKLHTLSHSTTHLRLSWTPKYNPSLRDRRQ